MLRSEIGVVVLGLSLGACGAPQLDAATRATLPHSSEPVVGEIQVTRADVSYDVHGTTTDALHESMHAYAVANWTDPDAVGLTDVAIGARMRCREYSDGGAIESAAVHVDLRVTLPRWVERDAASPDLQRRWDAFLGALRTHEEGHVQIAREYGDKLGAALQALRPQSSCQVLAQAAEDLKVGLSKAVQRDETGYDETTKHGALQGCSL